MTPDIQYLLADKHFIEPAHRGLLGREFKDIVSSKLTDHWELGCEGVWTYCNNLRQRIPLQGWKIHVSTIPAEAADLLRAAADVFVRNGTSFKFLSDRRILRAAHSKVWSRGSSGKFITAYPDDLESFKRLMEELYQSFGMRFVGPYILSDKRTRTAMCCITGTAAYARTSSSGLTGGPNYVLVAPDGREVPDRRGPFFELPAWEKDVFEAPAAPAADRPLNNRYVVQSALQFSNSGGVYLAQDTATDRIVVLKEARAHVHHGGDGLDARQMLRREHAVLQRIRSCGIAPQPIDLFEEWEHLFLAEEYLEGYLSLQSYAARESILLEPRPTAEKLCAFLKSLGRILTGLAAALDKLHSKGILFGDLSAGNVLFNPTTMDVKLVDFEGAQELDRGAVPGLFTLGFADPRLIEGAPPDCASDYYGFGMILLYLITHVNYTLEIKPGMAEEVLAEAARDFGWPDDLHRMLANLLNADPAARRARQRSWLNSSPTGPIGFGQGKQLGARGRMRQRPTLRPSCATAAATSRPRPNWTGMTDFFPPAANSTRPTLWASRMAHWASCTRCPGSRKRSSPACLTGSCGGRSVSASTRPGLPRGSPAWPGPCWRLATSTGRRPF